MGEFLDFDRIPVTPTSGNLLDTDTGFYVMVRSALRIIRTMIESALRVHETVHIIFETGNHDLTSSVMLREFLAVLYEQNERVTVDTSPSHFHYHSFGKTLIGTTHGHTRAKLKELPLVMAVDAPQWSQSDYRYIWTGHVHMDQVLDVHGCKVESFRVFFPGNQWSHNEGYRSMPEMKSIVLHSDYGEVSRHTVNPALLNS